MRRGRPNLASPPQPHAKPSASPQRGTLSDPFSALDKGKDTSLGIVGGDELSTRFPSLDQFSLLHDSGARFDFGQKAAPSSAQRTDINQRVTERLADEAFVKLSQPSPLVAASQRPTSVVEASPRPQAVGSQPQSLLQSSATEKPASMRPTVTVSRGTMTSPSPPPLERVRVTPQLKQSELSLPSTGGYRPSSQPQPAQARAASDGRVVGGAQLGLSQIERPILPSIHRSRSQNSGIPQSIASSRPSLEGRGPPAFGGGNSTARSKGVNAGRRPASLYLDPKQGILQDNESLLSPSGAALGISKSWDDNNRISSVRDRDLGKTRGDTSIQSNVEFLRAMEDEEGSKRKEKRSSSGSKHAKRASMPSMSLSNTKNLLAGKFGEAFRRFEANASGHHVRHPGPNAPESRRLRDLSPIATSEATSERSHDEHLKDMDEVNPELKRDLERRALAQEELRVEAAAADYRKRLAEHGKSNNQVEYGEGPTWGGPNKAASIQNKVKTLLDENTRPSPTNMDHSNDPAINSLATLQVSSELSVRSRPGNPGRASKGPVLSERQAGLPPEHLIDEQKKMDQASSTMSSPLSQRPVGMPRPTAPPKPDKLRTGLAQVNQSRESGSPRRRDPSVRPRLSPPSMTETSATIEEWEVNFSKRYPSLSHLEMVETIVDRGPPQPSTSMDVS